MKRTLMALVCIAWSLSVTVMANPMLAQSSEKKEVGANVNNEVSAQKKVNELLELLSEQEVQLWLRAQLKKKEAESAQEIDRELIPQDWIKIRLSMLEENIDNLYLATNEVPAQFEQFKANWIKELGDGDTLRALIYVIIFLIIGFGIEWLYWCYTSAMRERLTSGGDNSMLTRLTKYSLLKLLGISFFALGALGSFVAFDWKPLVELLVITLLLAIIVSRALQL
ncbi:hypothetical protein ACFL17_05710, partial [Pseudomonadota bacterium]